MIGHAFAPLNVVVFQRLEADPEQANLPLIGLPDAAFASFEDRPGLMTKRDIRLQVLGDLALQPQQIVWDIGAGTGSVSVEINRLCPDSQVYAVEKTAAGIALINRNREQLGHSTLRSVHGTAPQVLSSLPDPHRVFIGGSGGQLSAILNACARRLRPSGRMVLALATLEHLATVVTWVQRHCQEDLYLTWDTQYRQVQVHSSVQVGSLTRWHPLTPITIVTLIRSFE
jgi:precorrin-6Y C5,15-methyltransferase (decarboxylating)